MKLRGLFLMNVEVIPQMYGSSEEAELREMVDFVAPPLEPEEWLTSGAALEDVEVLYTGWGTPALSPAFLERFRSLRAVFHAGGTVKFFSTEAMWARGIKVTCAASANAIPVAEFTFAQIVFCLKHGWKRVREVERERRFLRDDEATPGTHGSTVGLLSLSRTGRMVAERLRSLEVEVIAYDPLVSAREAAALRVRLCSLEEIFARSDVLSCHTPLLPSTVRLLRGAHFEGMKAGATFINTARGGIVHEPEMIEVLRRRPDLFAVLDVTESEPPERDSPLFTLRNVVMTPHLAGSVGRECRRMGRMMVEETRRYLAGEPLQGEVRAEQLPFLA